MSCPRDAEIAAFLEGKLSEKAITEFEEHIDGCQDCQTLVTHASRALGNRRDDDKMEPGQRVGRYTLLGKVGRGNMGIVYGAYDPTLDRRVALKSILDLEDRKTAETRLRHEAQALAKLSHPNVVQIYEVLEDSGRTFLTMEYVAGATFSDWLGHRPRSPDEIIQLLCAAGSGLNAAHQTGLVHRDFKPDNILVDDKDRPRVSDFGLARLIPALATATSAPMSQSQAWQSRDNKVIAGTPAYMAPELFDGHEATAKSDQFAFAVVAYEALTGVHPFPAKSLKTLQAKLEGDPALPPAKAKAKIPTHILVALRRAMAKEPEERFVDLNELLETLGDGTHQPSRFFGALAIASVFAVILGLWFAGKPAPICTGSTQLINQIWNPQKAKALAKGFRKTQVSYASQSARTVTTLLDSYRQRWISERKRACESTHLRREQSRRLLDRRMRCYDERLWEMRTLIDHFGKADKALVRRSVRAAASLTPVERCAAAKVSAATDLPNSNTERRAVLSFREKLTHFRARQLAGDYKGARRQLEKAIGTSALAMAHEPSKADGLALLGDLHKKNGDRRRAEDALREAVFAGESSGNHTAAAQASIKMMGVLQGDASRHREVEHWARHAEHALRRSQASEKLRGDLALARGNLQLNKGQNPTKQYRLALERYRGENRQETPDAALALHNLAIAHALQGRLNRALTAHREALAIRRRLLGPRHPEVAESVHSLANVLNRMRRFRQAATLYNQAIAIATESLGASHPALGDFRGNLATTLMELGEFAAAERSLREAKSVVEKSTGNETSDIGYILVNFGDLAARQGHTDKALNHYKQALKTWKRTLAAQHPDLAAAHLGLAEVHLKRGEQSLAKVNAKRALELVGRQESVVAARSRFVLAQLNYVENPKHATTLARTSLDSEPDPSRKRSISRWLLSHRAGQR